MFKKISKICFTVVFLLILVVPLVTINLSNGKVSTAEKRKLAYRPHIHNGNGSLNLKFSNDFEKWINDNIGYRSQMVIANAKTMFYGFNILEGNSDMYIGPHGELDYITNDILKDYQHLDLKSDKELSDIANSYQTFSDYLKNQGIQYYYFQCWDKQSIYPEQFPTSIKQYGSVSKTDQIINTLKNKTTVNVISPKSDLIQSKSKYTSYSTWGDPTHWTQRGAYIGYTKLMNTINDNNSQKYRVLKPDDFKITITDQGKNMFGGIHQKCMLENFEIKNRTSYRSKEAPISINKELSWFNSKNILCNNKVNNKDTLLVIGDSYLDLYLYYHFGESFHRVVMVWGENVVNIKKLVDTYHPTIVVNENAERADRTNDMIKAATTLKK